jgi:hypothetical protein
MMKIGPSGFVVAIVVIGTGHSTLTQAGPPPGDPVRSGPRSGYTAPLSGEDLAKFNNVSAAERVQSKAQAKSEGGKLISALPLACDVTDAELIGRGKIKVDGKSFDVNAYEVACAKGMGYLLEAQGPLKPIAISCFAADAARAADLAQGNNSNFTCQLAANKDLNAMAATLLTNAGAICAVSHVRWFGLNAASQTEYTEVACGDGKGYLLKTLRTSSTEQLSAMSCQEAAKQGLQCHLTDGGPVPVPVTMQTYRDALKRNGVKCEPTNMRVVGRETIDKRYVVEVQCPEQPNGLVAFIPLEGNANEFETLDCIAAVERQITCKFTPK